MTEQERKNLELARRAREEDNAEDGKKYYDLVRSENPNNTEARFYYAYFNCWAGVKRDWYGNYLDLCNALPSIVRDTAKTDLSTSEKDTLLSEMLLKIDECYNACVKVSVDIDGPLFDIYAAGIIMFYRFGDAITESFPTDEKLMKVACESWKKGVKEQLDKETYVRDRGIAPKAIDSYTQKILKVDSSYDYSLKVRERQKQKAAIDQDLAKIRKLLIIAGVVVFLGGGILTGITGNSSLISITMGIIIILVVLFIAYKAKRYKEIK